MKIGLIGEAPNDTISIKNILEKKYKTPEIKFISLIDRLPLPIKGSFLDNPKTKNIIRRQYERKKPNIIIFIRDLDGLLNNKTQLKLRKEYFSDSNKTVDKKGIYLLNIYEIEALILSDIDTFNDIYGTNIEKFDNPMNIEEPKELLKKESKYHYNESHNPDIFKELDFDKVNNCKYFNEFIKKLDKILV